MPAPLIELRGICQSFNGHVVLDNANLTICPGDGVALLGPSGTGKSTILRIIAGLQVPDAGEVYINGKLRQGPIDDLERMIRMSMVFQQAALFDSLTVSENVGFFLFQNSRLSRSRICALVNEKLEMVGLPGTGDLYPAELSGGMRKRVSFARAILDDPDDPTDDPQILLYDEPTAGLDPIASTLIEELILELQKTSGCETYAIVTHQHSTIKRTGARVVMFYNGQVQWEGKAEDIEEPIADPYIRQFLRGDVHGPMESVDQQL